MRKIYFLMSFIFLVNGVAFAQYEEHAPMRKVLEFSLKGLKESVYKLEEKNAWFLEESQKLQVKIIHLQDTFQILEKEHVSLMTKKKSLDNEFDRQKKDVQLVERGVKNLDVQLQELDRKKNQLEEKIRIKKRRNEEFQNSIKQSKQDVLNLKNEIKKQQEIAKPILNNQEKFKWTAELQMSKENLSKGQKRLKELKVKHAYPLANLGSLEASNKILKERVKLSKAEFEKVVSNEQAIRYEMSEFKVKNQSNLAQLDKMINQLRLKDQELKNTLTKAKKRLDERGLNLSVDVEKEEQLKESLRLAKKENKLLYNKFLLLTKKLKKAQRQ